MLLLLAFHSCTFVSTTNERQTSLPTRRVLLLFGWDSVVIRLRFCLFAFAANLNFLGMIGAHLATAFTLPFSFLLLFKMIYLQILFCLPACLTA